MNLPGLWVRLNGGWYGGRVLFASAHALVAGAKPADATSSADDLVVGSGDAVDRGMTFYVAGTQQVRWFVSDSAGGSDAGLRWSGGVGFPALTCRLSNGDRWASGTTYFAPTLTTTAAYDLGISATNLWRDGFFSGALCLGSALKTDGAVGAVDLVIGNGTSAAVGGTLFTTAAGIARWGTTDVAGGGMRGGMQYNHSDDAFHMIAGAASVVRVVSGVIGPGSSGSPTVGSSSSKWTAGYINVVHFGVEPSAATITVGNNRLIYADASISNVDVQMPAAAAGLSYEIIVKDATNGVDVLPGSGDTINGAASKTLSVVGRYFISAEDATDWSLHGPLAVV